MPPCVLCALFGSKECRQKFSFPKAAGTMLHTLCHSCISHFILAAMLTLG